MAKARPGLEQPPQNEAYSAAARLSNTGGTSSSNQAISFVK